LFEAEPEFEEVALSEDMPPPAYQPATNADEPVDDFFQMEEDERSSFVAPKSRPVGQPSDETMARLHAAANKAPPAHQTAEAQSAAASAEKSRGFGLNSLISKMTGHNDHSGSSQRATHGAEPSISAARNESLPDDEPVMSEEQERIEIPAFLRRQAN